MIFAKCDDGTVVFEIGEENMKYKVGKSLLCKKDWLCRKGSIYKIIRITGTHVCVRDEKDLEYHCSFSILYDYFDIVQPMHYDNVTFKCEPPIYKTCANNKSEENKSNDDLQTNNKELKDQNQMLTEQLTTLRFKSNELLSENQILKEKYERLRLEYEELKRITQVASEVLRK